MLKIAIVGSMLLAVALSTYVTDLDNNLIEYEIEDIQPMQTISIEPYPYKNRNKQHILIEPLPAPVYPPHSNFIVPSTAVEVSSPGLVSTIISCSLSVAKKAITFIIWNAPGLIAGTVIGLGICKMTSLCGSDFTIVELQRELRSIATPDTMASVTNYVKEAIRKYSEMQV